MADSLEVVLVVHLVATAAMTGLIWFVQVVHYPLFSSVGHEQFVAYEAQHTRRTAWVVGPFMATEGLTALWLLANPGPDLGRAYPLFGLVLLAAVLGSTVLLQVPRHAKLSVAYDPEVARTLVSTNWIRTIGWSTRSVLAVAMVVLAN